jgi:hypothetical protein
MRKIYLLSAFVFFSVAASAQTLIPKIGFAIAKAKPSEGDGNVKSRLGLSLGAAVEFAINEQFSVQPELLIIGKGATMTDEDYEAKHRITYLELPVLAKAWFGEDDMRFYANAGPSFSFAMGGKAKYEFDGESETEKLKFGSDEDSDYKGFDLGFQLGGGILLMEKYQIDLRYGLGLSNISPVTDGGFSIKNKTLQITFGMPLNVFNN